MYIIEKVYLVHLQRAKNTVKAKEVRLQRISRGLQGLGVCRTNSPRRWWERLLEKTKEQQNECSHERTNS
jgi:hypothetical protein